MKSVIDDRSYFIQEFRGSYLPTISLFQGLIDGSGGKESICNAGDARHIGSLPMSGRSLQRRKWKLTPVFLPGKSHGQRSLAGYSPWSHKESDTTEHACTVYFSIYFLSSYQVFKN